MVHYNFSRYEDAKAFFWKELERIANSKEIYVEETVSAPRFKGALCSFTLSASDFDKILADLKKCYTFAVGSIFYSKFARIMNEPNRILFVSQEIFPYLVPLYFLVI